MTKQWRKEEDEAVKAAYEAGFDSEKTEPNIQNCSYKHFATHERTEAWQRGRDDAIKENNDGRKD